MDVAENLSVTELLKDLSLKSVANNTKNENGQEKKSNRSATDLGWEISRGLAFYEYYLKFSIIDDIRTSLGQEDYIVFDLGCGTGRFLAEIEALDSRIKAYGITDRLFNLHTKREKIIYGSFTRTEFGPPCVIKDIPNDSVNMVVSIFSIQYNCRMYDEQLMRDTYRILKPGGVAILDVIDKSDDGFISYELIEELGEKGILVKPHHKNDDGSFGIVKIEK